MPEATPTIFISGAAAGIGRATAVAFARRGYRVGAYDIDLAGLATLREEITSLGGEVVAVPMADRVSSRRVGVSELSRPPLGANQPLRSMTRSVATLVCTQMAPAFSPAGAMPTTPALP